MGERTPESKGRPIALNKDAVSASVERPAFLAPPQGALVYHGFPVLSDVTVDGFSFGKITDFETERCECGDAFVVAPDNSRCGLVWDEGETVSIQEIMPFENGRWGVWAAVFPFPMTNLENAKKNLESMLPDLKKKWEAWKRLRWD